MQPRPDDRQQHRDLVPEPPRVTDRREVAFDIGRGRVETEEAGHLFGMAQHHDERDRTTPIMGHQLHRPHAQPVQHGRQVVGHVVLQVARPWRRTPTGTAQIGTQHPVSVGGQRSDQLVPLPPVLREAVDQHHRRALRGSGVGDVDRHPGAQIDVLVIDTVESGHLHHGVQRNRSTQWTPNRLAAVAVRSTATPQAATSSRSWGFTSPRSFWGIASLTILRTTVPNCFGSEPALYGMP